MGDVSKEQALEIRRRYGLKGVGGAGMAVLAQQYGLHISTVHRILAGEHRHTRGLPSISGTRGGGIYDLGGRDKFSGTPDEKPDEVFHSMCTIDNHDGCLNQPCPVCGAKPRERCVNLRRPHMGPLKKLHEERGK